MVTLSTLIPPSGGGVGALPYKNDGGSRQKISKTP